MVSLKISQDSYLGMTDSEDSLDVTIEFKALSVGFDISLILSRRTEVSGEKPNDKPSIPPFNLSRRTSCS